MLGKHWICKHEDLGLIPRAHLKSKSWWSMLILPWIARQEGRNKGVRLAYLMKLWTD